MVLLLDDFIFDLRDDFFMVPLPDDEPVPIDEPFVELLPELVDEPFIEPLPEFMDEPFILPERILPDFDEVPDCPPCAVLSMVPPWDPLPVEPL